MSFLKGMKMRSFNVMLILALFSSANIGAFEDVRIGEEIIKPISYPKFSLMGQYNWIRQGSILGKDITTPLFSTFGGGLALDVGLYKYMNAGVIISTNAGKVLKDSEPVYSRLTVFARPLFTFFDRLNLFSRLGGGLSVLSGTLIGFGPLPGNLQVVGSASVRRKLDQSFDKSAVSHSLFNPGIHGVATIGIEYFPFSRFGVALEWGIWADFIFIGESAFFNQLNEEGARHGQPLKPRAQPFRYFSYDLPLTLTLSFIL